MPCSESKPPIILFLHSALLLNELTDFLRLRKVGAPEANFAVVLTLPLITSLNLVTVLIQLRVDMLRKGFWR